MGESTKGTTKKGRTDRKRRERQAKWLEAFSLYGNIVRACAETGIPRRTVYNWKLEDKEGNPKDPEFMALYEEAEEEAIEVLEGEARRRAFEGIEDFRNIGGQAVPVTKYSDVLLIFLLKGLRPERYRERSEVKSDVNLNARGKVLILPSNGRGPEDAGT